MKYLNNKNHYSLHVMGENLYNVAKTHKTITNLTQIINNMPLMRSKAVVDNLIQQCLLHNVECQMLIEVLNADEDIQKEYTNYFLQGYLSAKNESKDKE